MTNNKDRLLEHIPLSPGRIHMRHLAEACHVNERQIRDLISTLRIDGELIGSDNEGYYIPASTEELVRYYRTQRARAITTLRSLKQTRRHLIEAGMDLSALEGRGHVSEKPKT